MKTKSELSAEGLAQEIFEGYPAPTLVVDDDVRLVMLNRAARQALGDAPEPRRAGDALHCVHAERPDGCGQQEECKDCVIRNSVKQALTTGEVHRARAFTQVRVGEGSADVCHLVSASPIRIDGAPRVILTLEDVSDVQLRDQVARAEAALRQADQRAASLARFPEENPDPVLRLGADLTLIYANATAHSAFGALGVEVGRAASAFLAAPARQALAERRRIWAEIAAGGRVFSLSCCPVGTEVNVYAQDVTDRKRAADQLAAERERLAVTLASIGDGVIATDEAGRVTMLNGVAEALTGWTSAAAAGRPIDEVFDIVSEVSRRPAENPVGRALREGIVVGLANHTALVARDGSERPIADSAAPIRDSSGRLIGVVLVFRDQTEERRVEQAMRQSEAQLRTIIENLAEGLVVSSLDGQLDHWNRAALRMHGLASMEECRRKLPELTDTFELSTLGGAPVPVADWPLARILRGEQVRDLELRVRNLRAGWTRIFRYAGVLVRDADGTPLMGVVTMDDVTERKQAEQALLDADRHKNEFLAVLSHELRNPLAPIRNSLYLLDRVPAGSEQATRARAVLGRQTDHLARLVDDLLDVTRISRGKIELERAVVDACQVVRHACQDHRSLFEELGVELRVALPAAPLWIDADATRVAQILSNLLQNAAKFSQRGGITVVAAAEVDGQAELRVRDDGVGIEADLLGVIFEPFSQAERTLARTQGGLGLGLSLVRGLVELHGGTVQALSRGPGTGSEFVVRLPLAAARPAAGPEGAEAGARAARSVLIIEDYLDSGQTLAEVLTLHGYRVEVVTDGATGIARAQALRPDVVLCDIGLPDVDGYRVARALRADPALRSTYLVALSGYSQPEDRRLVKEAGFDAHLPKPAALAELLAILAAADRGQPAQGVEETPFLRSRSSL